MGEINRMKIAVAGTGYVGLSLATLLSQKHEVIALDVIPEKVEKINNRISPIQDEYIASKKSYDQPRQHIKKQRHYFANKGLSSQKYGFSSSHVWI